jgi:hypothetical protein
MLPPILARGDIYTRRILVFLSRVLSMVTPMTARAANARERKLEALYQKIFCT